MDIVSRIKTFMDNRQIANSQFADNCGIPRPTVSQILNGRNKKISDELIAKIHAAYPELSISWLLFGEGDMVTVSNIEISKPQNGQNLSFLKEQGEDSQQLTTSDDLFSPYTNNSSEKLTDFASGDFSRETPSQTEFSRISAEISNNGSLQESKRIKNILVFYEDNTFQTFTPTK